MQKRCIKHAILLLPWIFLIPFNGLGQSSHSFLRKGDKSYKDQEYSDAEENYRKALEKDNSEKGTYNLGNTIYNQKRFDEAIKHYSGIAESSRDKEIKARAYHNLGNAHFSKQEYDKSVNAYKNALRLKPKDLETKQNLALAQRQLQMQQQQQQQQQEQEQQEQEQQQQQQQEQEQQPQEKDLTKEEARQLLEIMEEEERKVQEKLRKLSSKKSKSKKDW